MGDEATAPGKARCLECGLLAGTLQAGVFNPWDRALYLAHLNKRPFLHQANFHRPYEGFHQSILHRVISGGLYFPLEDVLRSSFPENHGPVVHSFISGVIAGSVIAMLTNPLAAIKYQSWGSDHRGRMLVTARDMLARGGPGAFFRAIHTTLLRDTVWGGTYAVLRHTIPRLVLGDAYHEQEPGLLSFASNMVAGACGTVLSAPLNYARNLQYGRNISKTTQSTRFILRRLVKDALVHRHRTGGSSTHFMMQRLAIGWGTLRVALGLGFSSQVYTYCLLATASS